jgi:PIN domain nuclease of toxin-antitoxin system
MIVLDTHIWIWWVHDTPQLAATQAAVIAKHEADIIGVSVISCWEVAKLVEYQRLVLPCDISTWFQQALTYPGVQLLELTPEIAIESTHLPGTFHRDPADQLIVATARIHACPIVTADNKILNYTHVQTIA